jgi:transcriptional regulator GlxA family with amidase domain
MTAHDVLIPVHEGFQPLDVVGPYDVLTGAGRVLEGGAGYRVRLASADGGTVRSVDGLRLGVDEALPEDGPIGTLLVPGGEGTREAMQDEHFVGWVRRAAERSERVVSVCTGAFVLAAAGLLDGLSATTHWRWAPTMQRAFPGVDVRSDPLFVRQGRVWTAAGITAGIDLSLALVEADHGPRTAQLVARELVVFLRRPGGQSQFAGPVWAPPAQQPAVRAAQDLIHAEPAADLRVPVLAAKVGMSERHFSREFTRELGTPPGDYVEQVRVDAARRLLEAEPALVSVVADRAGFRSTETMRRAFVRRLGVPPDHYRRTFATTTPRS